MSNGETRRRVVSLWQQGFDTADIAKLTGLHESDVEKILHRWREEKRSGIELGRSVLCDAGRAIKRPRQILAPTLKPPTKRPAVNIDEALKLARSWEANRPSRH